MGSVANLDDMRPHVKLPTPDGKVHVFPVALMQDIADGKSSVDGLGADRDQILRAIIQDWLESF